MKILMIAVTNFDLYYISSVAYLLKRKDKDLKIKLLLRYTFEESLTSELKALYSEVELFEVPTLTFAPRSKSKLKAFVNYFNFYQPLRFKRWIKKILADVDIICICPFREFFANILCKAAPKDIHLVALRVGNQQYEIKTKYIRKPLTAHFLNVKNFLFGYSTIDYKWRADSKKDLLSKNFKRNPYHRIISITDHNFYHNGIDYHLPPPFVAIKELYSSREGSPIILVAGEKTPLYEGWNKNDQMIYEGFLDYLRNNFRDFKLCFKPKKWKTDWSRFNLQGFEILNPSISLEEFCTKNNVKKVISIMSSASKIGCYYGIASYLLYPLFNFPKLFKSVIKNFFADMASIKRIKRLEELHEIPAFSKQMYNVDYLADIYHKSVLFKEE